MLSGHDNSFEACSTHFLGEGTSSSARLSLDSGIGLTNDSILSDDQNETNRTFDDSGCYTSGREFGESPPTKWARITTPPNRKTASDMRLQVNIFSPPSLKDSGFVSPNSMRTPTTRGRIRISTPSPFRVTISKTPLKLSNNQNVAGYHIGRQDDIKTVNSTPMVRCIGVTSASKRCLIANTAMENYEIDDSPTSRRFEGFSELPNVTPGKINAALESDEPIYFEQTSSTSVPSSLPFPKKREIPEEDCFANLLQPCGIGIGMAKVESCSYVDKSSGSYAIITNEPLKENRNLTGNVPVKKKKSLVLQTNEQDGENARKVDLKRAEIEKWKKEPFVTPTKDVKPYSGQWLVISTGRTLAQQNLYSEAVQFLKSKMSSDVVSSSSSIRSSRRRKMPTITRINLFKHRFSKMRLKLKK